MIDDHTALEIKRVRDHGGFEAYLRATLAEVRAEKNALAVEESRKERPWNFILGALAALLVAQWVMGFLTGWGTVLWSVIKPIFGW